MILVRNRIYFTPCSCLQSFDTEIRQSIPASFGYIWITDLWRFVPYAVSAHDNSKSDLWNRFSSFDGMSVLFWWSSIGNSRWTIFIIVQPHVIDFHSLNNLADIQPKSRTDLRATSEVTEGLGQRGGGPQPLQPLELLGWAPAGSLRSFPGWLPRYAAGQRKLGTHEVATETWDLDFVLAEKRGMDLANVKKVYTQICGMIWVQIKRGLLAQVFLWPWTWTAHVCWAGSIEIKPPMISTLFCRENTQGCLAALERNVHAAKKRDKTK